MHRILMSILVASFALVLPSQAFAVVRTRRNAPAIHLRAQHRTHHKSLERTHRKAVCRSKVVKFRTARHLEIRKITRCF